MDDFPVIARTKPYLVSLAKAGRTYFWCACSRSKTQPFCDGSHKGTGIEPVAYRAQEDGEEVLLCGCKHTRNPPFCDGTHNNLADAYEEASEEERAATADIPVTPRDGGAYGKAVLDGGCYVLKPASEGMREEAGWRFLPLIGSADRAEHLSLFVFETHGGIPRPVSFDGSETVVFVRAGAGRVHIGDRRFAVAPETGVYIRAGEAFTAEPDDHTPLELIVAVCPLGPQPRFLESMPEAFDEEVGKRKVSVDPRRRENMADRFYQVLVGEVTSSHLVTQFVGEIPRSRAAAHRHLYEEAIVVLSGEGFMWTEDARARVAPGDVIFLPAKQLHSLECTSESGLRLMGVFYPAGSPAVNY